MSFDLSLDFDPKKRPSVARWQEEIVNHGFAICFDASVSDYEQEGWLPMKLEGEVAGFEFYYSTAQEKAEMMALIDDPELDELPPDDTDTISICCGGGASARSGIIALAVLAELTGGELRDPQAGVGYAGSAALDWARRELSAF